MQFLTIASILFFRREGLLLKQNISMKNSDHNFNPTPISFPSDFAHSNNLSRPQSSHPFQQPVNPQKNPNTYRPYIRSAYESENQLGKQKPSIGNGSRLQKRSELEGEAINYDKREVVREDQQKRETGSLITDLQSSSQMSHSFRGEDFLMLKNNNNKLLFQNKTLKKQIENLKHVSYESEKILQAEKQSIISNCQKEMQLKNSQIMEWENHSKSLQAEIQGLSDLRENLFLEIETLKQQISEKNKLIVEMDGKEDKKNSSLPLEDRKSLFKKINFLQQKNRETTKKNHQLEIEIQSLKDLLARKTNQEAEQLKIQVQKLEKKIKNLQKRLSEEEQNQNNIKTVCATMVKELRQQIQILEQSNCNLRQIMVQKQNEEEKNIRLKRVNSTDLQNLKNFYKPRNLETSYLSIAENVRISFLSSSLKSKMQKMILFTLPVKTDLEFKHENYALFFYSKKTTRQITSFSA